MIVNSNKKIDKSAHIINALIIFVACYALKAAGVLFYAFIGTKCIIFFYPEARQQDVIGFIKATSEAPTTMFVAAAVFILVLRLYPKAVRNNGEEGLGFDFKNHHDWSQGFLPGCVIAVAAIILFFVVSPGAPLIFSGNEVSVLKAVSIFIATAIFTPIIEEIIFRGVLYSSIFAVFDKEAAILGTIIIFALFHLVGQEIHLWAFMSVLAFSATATWLRVKTKSIAPAIIMHATHNAIIIAVMILTGEMLLM